jgi:hypothetical protein
MQSIHQNTSKPNQINGCRPIDGSDCQTIGYRLERINLSIDRVDYNGVMDSCTKPVLCLIINGEIRKISDWAAMHGISAGTLRSRAERQHPLASLFEPPACARNPISPKIQAKRDEAATARALRDAERREFGRLLARVFAPCVGRVRS